MALKAQKKIEPGDKLFVKHERYKGQSEGWNILDDDGTVLTKSAKQAVVTVTDVKMTKGTITITGKVHVGEYYERTVRKKFNLKSNKTFSIDKGVKFR